MSAASAGQTTDPWFTNTLMRIYYDQIKPAGLHRNRRFKRVGAVAQCLTCEKEGEPAGKPGSVVGNHSSGSAVTIALKRPTRKHRGPRLRFPTWSCSGWGLPSRSVLPPARCALTAPFHPYLAKPGGILSVALSVSLRPPGVTWHPALRSPDFPPHCPRAMRRLPGRLSCPLSPIGDRKALTTRGRFYQLERFTSYRTSAFRRFHGD